MSSGLRGRARAMESAVRTQAMMEVRAELDAAMDFWPPFHSAHEGYAVILEELDELWEQAKVNEELRDRKRLHDEAMQVAAMAIRFMIEITGAVVI